MILRTFIFTLGLLTGFSLNAQTKQALFLGNSYTFYNDLPELVNQVAQGNGDTLIHDSNTPGGYTFEGHSTNATSILKIQSGGWDYVILQEQSQLPSFPITQVEEDCFPYAETLVNEIRNSNDCAVPVFYMTWGRKDGDASNCEFWPPVCTYEGMQELLTERYTQMAFDNEAYVGPVGEAWRLTRENYPDIELYASDGSHPSYAGSYLAACVFYSSMWQEESSNSDFYGDLDENTATSLQEMADEAVFGGEDWNFYDLLSYELDLTEGDVMHFLEADLSPYIDYLEITIEGETYILADGEEAVFFLVDENSTAEVVVVSPCGSSTSNVVLSDLITSIPEIVSDSKFSIYPNPTSDVLRILSKLPLGNIQIWDTSGRLILEEMNDTLSADLDLSRMESGMYYISVNGGLKKAFVVE